jgi:hypothetical protein
LIWSKEQTIHLYDWLKVNYGKFDSFEHNWKNKLDIHTND